MYSVSRNWATAHHMRLNLKVAAESFANAADTAQLSSAKLTPRAPVTIGEGDRPIPARRMRTPSHAAIRGSVKPGQLRAPAKAATNCRCPVSYARGSSMTRSGLRRSADQAQ
jgi:hypothetical protein